MTGMVFVAQDGLRGASLRRWVVKSVTLVESLPPKG